MITLTKRQCAVLWGLSAGLTLPEIAERLKLSLPTVSGHRSQLGLALGLPSSNIVSLLRAAVADGHIPADVLGRSVTSILKNVV